MEMFAQNDEVARLEAALLPQKNADRPAALAALAWHLRQRNTQRAISLTTEARALLPQAAFTPEQRQTIAARLDLVCAEAKWLFADLEAAQSLTDRALMAFDASGDAIGCADAHWLMAWIAADRGEPRRCDAELELAIEQARRGAAPTTCAKTSSKPRWPVLPPFATCMQPKHAGASASTSTAPASIRR
jgi:hypothetical protein